MEIKKYSEEDLPYLVMWASERGLNLPVPAYHPECGAVVIHEGKRICAAFLYRTDGHFTAIDGIISDPKADPETRSKALDVLIEGLIELSRQCGFPMVSACSNNEKLCKRYEKHGFKVAEKGLTMFIREE